MSHLVLIRHSKTEPGNAAEGTDWPLSAEGRTLCGPLAGVLKQFQLDILVSSRMLRAQQTAELLADRLGVAWRCADGLEEHRRPFVGNADAFFPLIEALFAHPSRQVFGDSAEETLARFSSGIETVMANEPAKNVGVVTHGTVMALYAAPRFDMRPYDLWRAIGHPCVIVIERESGRGVCIVDSLTSTA